MVIIRGGISRTRRPQSLTPRNSELAREKMWSRIHLIPVLQAEEDRDLVRRHLADQAREKELLGENVKVYHSDRYAYFHAARDLCPQGTRTAQYRVVLVLFNSADHMIQICPPNLRRGTQGCVKIESTRRKPDGRCEIGKKSLRFDELGSRQDRCLPRAAVSLYIYPLVFAQPIQQIKSMHADSRLHS